MRIFDCFTFFNELDLLEIRLAEHAPVVDTFVIAESNVTFQGNSKPLYFQENRERYKKYDDKIVHLVIDDMPNTQNPWEREHFQRNALKRGLPQAENDDMVLISDADEVFTRTAIEELKIRKTFTFLQQRLFAYFLNAEICDGPDIPWIKAYAAPYSFIRKMDDLTAPRDGDPQHHPQRYLKSVGLGLLNQHLIQKGGWHFSWFGQPERILTKLDSFSHTEERTRKWKNRDFIARSIAKRKFFPSGANLAVQTVDEDFPILVQEQQDVYFRDGLLAPIPAKRSFFERFWKRSA